MHVRAPFRVGGMGWEYPYANPPEQPTEDPDWPQFQWMFWTDAEFLGALSRPNGAAGGDAELGDHGWHGPCDEHVPHLCKIVSTIVLYPYNN